MLSIGQTDMGARALVAGAGIAQPLLPYGGITSVHPVHRLDPAQDQHMVSICGCDLGCQPSSACWIQL